MTAKDHWCYQCMIKLLKYPVGEVWLHFILKFLAQDYDDSCYIILLLFFLFLVLLLVMFICYLTQKLKLVGQNPKIVSEQSLATSYGICGSNTTIPTMSERKTNTGRIFLMLWKIWTQDTWSTKFFCFGMLA